MHIWCIYIYTYTYAYTYPWYNRITITFHIRWGQLMSLHMVHLLALRLGNVQAVQQLEIKQIPTSTEEAEKHSGSCGFCIKQWLFFRWFSGFFIPVYPNLIQILSKSYPNLIQILSKSYPIQSIYIYLYNYTHNTHLPSCLGTREAPKRSAHLLREMFLPKGYPETARWPGGDLYWPGDLTCRRGIDIYIYMILYDTYYI